MERTQDLNESNSFWLSEYLDDDAVSLGKVLTKDDIKKFIKVEME